MTSASPAWLGFATHLAVVPTEEGEYEGWCLPGRGSRPYGGQLVAQGLLLALQHSPSGMSPLSVNSHFLRSGDSDRAVRHRLDCLRVGRTLEHWRVEAWQDDRLLTLSTIVLHRPEQGPAYAPNPHRSAPPEGWPVVTRDAPDGTPSIIRSGFEIRRQHVWAQRDPREASQDVWFRCIEDVTEQQYPAILAWSTDLELAPTVDLRYRDRVSDRHGASLDHTIHFHSPINIDQWWVIEHEGLALSQGRGLAVGRVFSERRELLATVTQRTLVRLEINKQAELTSRAHA